MSAGATMDDGPGNARSTDFGRDTVATSLPVTVAEALRHRATSMNRVEAFRYQLGMALVGFVAGLIVVLPLVLWLANGRQGAALQSAQSVNSSAVRASVSGGRHVEVPVLQAVPTRIDRSLRPEPAPPVVQQEPEPPRASETARVIETARGAIRSGDVLAARELLSRPDLNDLGEAHFMLAETYDPNVLAALGAQGVHAEAPVARRYYEAALAKGIAAAAKRLEALE